MTDINLAELRAIAEAAIEHDSYQCTHAPHHCRSREFAADAPEVVLGLLDRLERYETALIRISPYGFEGEIAAHALNPTEAKDD